MSLSDRSVAMVLYGRKDILDDMINTFSAVTGHPPIPGWVRLADALLSEMASESAEWTQVRDWRLEITAPGHATSLNATVFTNRLLDLDFDLHIVVFCLALHRAGFEALYEEISELSKLPNPIPQPSAKARLEMHIKEGNVEKVASMLQQYPGLASEVGILGVPAIPAAAALISLKSNPQRATALHASILRGDLSRAKLLLDHGADPNVPNYHGSYPLHDAVDQNHKDAVELLLQHGARHDVKDYADYSPLHFAARSRNQEIIKLLLSAGADPTIDAEGKMPYQLSQAAGNPAIRMLLTPLQQLGPERAASSLERLLGALAHTECTWPHVKVQILGDAGHGKTSFVKWLVGEHVLKIERRQETLSLDVCVLEVTAEQWLRRSREDMKKTERDIEEMIHAGMQEQLTRDLTPSPSVPKLPKVRTNLSSV